MPADAPYPSSYRPPFDARPRIAELQRMLNKNEVEEGQRINLQAAIQAYQKGLLKSMDTINYIQDGMLLGDDITKLHGRSPWWTEVCFFSLNNLPTLITLFDWSTASSTASATHYDYSLNEHGRWLTMILYLEEIMESRDDGNKWP